eukprot:2365967-Amphidinium_carterae.1
MVWGSPRGLQGEPMLSASMKLALRRQRRFGHPALGRFTVTISHVDGCSICLQLLFQPAANTDREEA